MPGHFWDTSALLKHYHPELGTVKVDALLQAPGLLQVLSRLGVTETFSVFAGKVRAGLITQAEFDVRKSWTPGPATTTSPTPRPAVA